ncbi:hypothetical protein [uncultured Bacteroides sp.]|uniref:hypothetical protein n=1 Tax=uncultured Bacteroides sp. TaxID=162156 RepID=UPI0025E07329|nr:hypothetical protein [uncultured Bacteroides sp.]
MIRKLYTLLMLGLCLGFTACGEDSENIDPNAAVPAINLPMEEINIDLNNVDHLPVVAVIRSEAGLKNISMKIQTAEGTVDYKTVTDFFNPNSYSLSEELEYGANYQAFIIEATDKLNHVTTGNIIFNVTDVVERPTITFDPEEIIYDEMDDNLSVIPPTSFKVTSEGGLKSITITLASGDTQQEMFVEELNGEKEYTFNQQINYKDGDKGLKVKAEDSYGYITIATLPVTYRAIPGPEILELQEIINGAKSGQTTYIPINVNSVRGIRNISIYTKEGTNEEQLLKNIEMQGETSWEGPLEVTLSEATSQLRVVVSDGRENKNAEKTIKTYVDMTYTKLLVAASRYANAPHANYPDVYSIISCNDLKTHSVDEVLEKNRIADFTFYAFGGSSELRFYSMEVKSGNKYNEYKGSNGKTLANMSERNKTMFSRTQNFDFENATTSSISSSWQSGIQADNILKLQEKEVIIFQTDAQSSAGLRKGAMRVIKSEQIGQYPVDLLITLEIKLLDTNVNQ